MLKDIIITSLLVISLISVGFVSGWYFEKTSLDRYNKCVDAVDDTLQKTLLLTDDYHHQLYLEAMSNSSIACIRFFSN